MPVQSWTSGQTLTAAELTSVTNMLPYPAVAGSNVSPCVAGTYYFCTATVTMTMPAPSTGTTIGFRCTGGAGVTINNHASEHFFSPYLPSSSATSFTLAAIGQYVVFLSDGSDWYEIESGGLAGKGVLASVTTTGGPAITTTGSPGTLITGATATLTLVAGRTIRISYNGSAGVTVSANGAVLITKAAAAFANSQRNFYSVAGFTVSMNVAVIDTPAAGSVTYTAAALIQAGTLTPTAGLFTVEDVT